jgi:hypothetical protein
VTTLGGQTVTVVHRTSDDYGDRIETGRDDYPGCSIQPLSTSERLETGDQALTRWTVYGPPTLAAGPMDQLISDGITYELDGDIQLWRDLTGQPHHVEAFLRRATG